MGRSRSRSPTRHSSSRRDRSTEHDRERDSKKSRRHDDYDSDSRRKRHRSRSREKEDRERDRHRSKKTRSRSRSKERDRDRKEKKRDRSSERAARKADKRREREELGASLPTVAAELSAYDALDNPFHDANLNQQFKWHKKTEKEKKAGISVQESQRREATRRQEAKVSVLMFMMTREDPEGALAQEELERLNKRRAEREIEQQLREEEDARMQRLAESAQMAEWISKEGDFQLEQERRRAGIRLKEKRGKAIDFLVLNLKFATDASGDVDDGLGLDDIGLEIDFDEPYAIFENLSLEQTEELHDDIQKYLSLEQSQTNIDFWTNMMVVCKDRLDQLHSNTMGNNNSVESDISSLLSGKTYDQLSQLQRQIQTKLSSGEPIDVDYWEGLLKSLLVWKAKAKLKSLHEAVVRNRLEQLRRRQRDEAFQAQSELLAAATSRNRAFGGDMHADAGKDTEEPAVKEQEDIEPYEQRQVDIIDIVEDLAQLFTKRRAITSTLFVPKASKPEVVVTEGVVVDTGASSAADIESEALYRAEAEKNMDEEEELYNLEELIVNPTTYTWEDKYRPRKPRYFNRIHTGYEWNKYNQTHYDTDNPPPKVVQGYKFNIFYPDLIDKSKAPTYKIVKEPGNEDTVLLHFTAGPPYEDIAFRVVNREWEYSHKRGFRSSFDRGCLSLWFNFRRNYYRK
ncbi:Conserved mid region of cactin [Rhizoctonia solani]|uniref:Splicing factor Cactin n=1 Tax=Rhizoctonia solani TaxID=456999 RepID=A0A8H7IIR6_9AGAM|nr:Conserved mid region of cactin [Rhizoctonia solani]